MKYIRDVLENNIHISMEKLYIELTNRCNLKCIHCYNESNSGLCVDLPLENVMELLDYVKESHLTSVALSGGEALLYPHIKKVLEKCKELELDVMLLTNGTYTEGDIYLDILLKYLPNIQVSLDGPDFESNDKIRGTQSFQRTIAFIKKLKALNYPKRITVNTVLTEHTIQIYHNMIELCQQLGIDEITYSFVTMAGRAKKNITPIQEDLRYSIVKDINSNIKVKPENKCQGVGINHICSLTTVENNIIKLQPKVTCKGDVYPCQMHQKPEYIIGNVLKHSLKNVLNSKESRRFIILMFLRKYFMKECKKCLFESLCGRGCMAKAVNDYNNPFAADGCCKFYKELILSTIKHDYLQ